MTDKLNMQLHALDKKIIKKYDSVAESLGFRSRSEMMRYMINKNQRKFTKKEI